MKVYTYSQARQNLAELLDSAREAEVLIRRKGGDVFSVTLRRPANSPFDVPSVKTKATTQDIVEAVRDSRKGRDRS